MAVAPLKPRCLSQQRRGGIFIYLGAKNWSPLLRAVPTVAFEELSIAHPFWNKAAVGGGDVMQHPGSYSICQVLCCSSQDQPCFFSHDYLMKFKINLLNRLKSRSACSPCPFSRLPQSLDCIHIDFCIWPCLFCISRNLLGFNWGSRRALSS